MSQSQDNHEVELAADDGDDPRSEIGSSIASSRTSLRDSIIDYRIENGRSYHRYKEGKYNLPNDDQENDRLDSNHQLWLITLDDKLGVAPPCEKNATVGRVLDVGTGTGIWAIDFGDEHPEADVYGNDLSAVQPTLVPPNVKFEVDDIEDEWTYSRPFEYIHSRLMTSSLSDWPVFLRRCFDNLEPGGYLELKETDIIPRSDDDTLNPAHALMKWANLLLEASIKLGRPYMEIPSLKQLMIEAGFEDVTMHVYKWPTNGWPKDPRYREIGLWNYENTMMGLEGYTMAPLTRALDWMPAEVDVFLIDVRNDLKDRSIHAYWPQYAIVGRKPQKEESPAAA
ncbi:Secondary metabolism regulator LAE1 [Colletotrichum siamense]|uniref:Secondary metabolism regulator LAE1 n=1 Tax=Colletotrichum siamense TaxID=690259 RepID=A0A9P5K613_COLSI|nr:Secondary metabolism regulator LAE1 [Colletotrichum siamense]KAF4859431.1 Secondary metabolism regulator LAE1 [Colletotrichum siamense]